MAQRRRMCADLSTKLKNAYASYVGSLALHTRLVQIPLTVLSDLPFGLAVSLLHIDRLLVKQHIAVQTQRIAFRLQRGCPATYVSYRESSIMRKRELGRPLTTCLAALWRKAFE